MSDLSNDEKTFSIIKRDGREQLFDAKKIKNAIIKANNAIDSLYKISDHKIDIITDSVIDEIKRCSRQFNVEEIQDLVEKNISKYSWELAKAFTIYRYEHALQRDGDKAALNAEEAKKYEALMDRAWNIYECESEDIHQENANKNAYLLSTQADYAACEVDKELIKYKGIFSDDVLKAHAEGIIKIHDMGYSARRMFNCFSGDTTFISEYGDRQFKWFNDGDKVHVVDRFGDVREATVKKYGKQYFNNVYLKNNKTIKVIKATKNHRWYLHDGSVTTDLKVGDRLFTTKKSENGFNIDKITTKHDAFLFCLGMVIGDGYDGKNNSGEYSCTKIRLCGDKAKYSKLFEMAGFSKHFVKHTTDPYFYYKEAIKQNFLNGKGWKYLSSNDKIILFNGYFCADGSTSDRLRCSTADDRIACMIYDLCGISGYYLVSANEIFHDTNYKKNARLYNFSFVNHQSDNQTWKVVKIDENKSYGDAWCLEEPVTHSFLLSNGITTGNCCLINLDDMFKNGTVINGVFIETPKSFDVACTVATQIESHIASGQYGGQTVNLWHIAQFIKITREKLLRRTRERYEEIGMKYTEEQLINDTELQLKQHIKDGIQLLQYQILTHMTTNG